MFATSRFVPMDFSYPDDSYPGLDVSYPHSAIFVPNPLDDSYPTKLWHRRVTRGWRVTMRATINIVSQSPCPQSTVKCYGKSHPRLVHNGYCGNWLRMPSIGVLPRFATQLVLDFSIKLSSSLKGVCLAWRTLLITASWKTSNLFPIQNIHESMQDKC